MDRPDSGGLAPSREPSRVANGSEGYVTRPPSPHVGDYRHFVRWIAQRTGYCPSMVRCLIRGLMATGEVAIRRDRKMPSGLRVVPLKLDLTTGHAIPRQTPPVRRGGKP